MDGMIYRTLGRTGEKVSAVGLGGYHIGKQEDEAESIRIIRSAIENGITFMDNSWDYHQGRSEVRMGKALRDGYRDKVFLMTKIDGRTKDAAERQINECLERLATDRIDLIQFHEIIRITDPDRIFGKGGAIEAASAAKKAGKVRFVGFTGHKDPFIHLAMLEAAARHHFRFDTVQMPLNLLDAHLRSFEREVLPVLEREKTGILAMKHLADGKLLEAGTGVTPIECLHYVLNLPVSTAIVGIDNARVLEETLEAVRTFKPMSPVQVTALLDRTSPAALSGRYELYKFSSEHDGTAVHPDWLG